MDFVPFEIRKLVFSLLPAALSDTQAIGSSLAILDPFVSSRCVLHCRTNGEILFLDGQQLEIPSA